MPIESAGTQAKSYRYLRIAMVGLLIALAAAVFYQSSQQGSFLASVSAYYYTPAQAVFVGALIGWAIGRYGGRPLLERRSRWFHVTPERLDRAEAWFDRWGNWGVFIGRITPVVRSFVSITAGIFEMPLVPYMLLSLAGSAVWAFVFAGAGYGLGTGYRSFDHDFRYAEYAIVAGVVLVVAYLVYRWVAAARVSAHADDSAG